MFVSAILSGIYTATIATSAFPGRWALKAGSIAILATFVLHEPAMALGLLAGSIGDALLEMDRSNFTMGLAAFLVGHLCYVFSFVRRGRQRVPVTVGMGIAGVALAYLVWLWPGLGTNAPAVSAYVAVITAMTVSSLRIGGCVTLGAVLFFVSDALLAANKFRVLIPYSGYAIWGTYYAAQVLIALGWSRHSPGSLYDGIAPRGLSHV